MSNIDSKTLNNNCSDCKAPNPFPLFNGDPRGFQYNDNCPICSCELPQNIERIQILEKRIAKLTLSLSFNADKARILDRLRIVYHSRGSTYDDIVAPLKVALDLAKKRINAIIVNISRKKFQLKAFLDKNADIRERNAKLFAEDY